MLLWFSYYFCIFFTLKSNPSILMFIFSNWTFWFYVFILIKMNNMYGLIWREYFINFESSYPKQKYGMSFHVFKLSFIFFHKAYKFYVWFLCISEIIQYLCRYSCQNSLEELAFITFLISEQIIMAEGK